MGYGVDKQGARRIKEDAGIAIDKLNSILIECSNEYVHAPYIMEKIEAAKRCVEFIYEETKEILDNAD